MVKYKKKKEKEKGMNTININRDEALRFSLKEETDEMKLGVKVVLLLRDPEGFGQAIYDSSHPDSSSSVAEEQFELSLERYGIRNCKASGKVRHFLDLKGQFKASVLLMEHYESPILACALNEVLAQIAGQKSASMPTIVAPFFIPSSKLKWDSKSATKFDSKDSLYGIQIGPETDISKDISTRTQKAPPSLQIDHEPLACLLQIVRVLNMPTFVLLGQRGQRISEKEELEILYEIGELLANSCKFNFSRGFISWKPTKKSKDEQEPWRALYG